MLVDDRRQQFARLELLVAQFELAGAEARVIGQIAHLRFQMPGRAFEPLDHLAVRLGLKIEAEQFDRRHDRMQRRAQFVADHAEEGVLREARLTRGAGRLMLGFERGALLADQAAAAAAVHHQQQRGRRREQHQHDPGGKQHAPLVDEIAAQRFAVGDVGKAPAQGQIVDLLPVRAQRGNDEVGLVRILRQRFEVGLELVQHLFERADLALLTLQQRELTGQHARRAGHHVQLRLQHFIAQLQPRVIDIGAAAIQQQLVFEARVGNLQLRGVPIEAVVRACQQLRGARVEQVGVHQVADRPDRRGECGDPDHRQQPAPQPVRHHLTIKPLICHTNFESAAAPESSVGNASRG